jgi:hypothetical protein
MGCLWGVALLLGGLSACGSSSSKCTTNCKADGALDVVAPADHLVETDGAGSRDAPADSPRDAKDSNDAKLSIDGAVACDRPIAAACAGTADAGVFTFHCATTWSATTSNAYLCGRPEVLIETCGSDRELIDTNNAGTAEYIYVFDGSGKLFAISYSVGGAVHCVAGPPEFVAPVGCGAPALFSCATDGGHKG